MTARVPLVVAATVAGRHDQDLAVREEDRQYIGNTGAKFHVLKLRIVIT
jgi:hypothetical protein